MTESIPSTWNDERDTAFFGIADNLTADGFAHTSVTLANGVSDNDDLSARLETVVQDLIGAESWETMALRCAARATTRHRDLVPVPARRPRVA